MSGSPKYLAAAPVGWMGTRWLGQCSILRRGPVFGGVTDRLAVVLVEQPGVGGSGPDPVMFLVYGVVVEVT